MPQDPFPALTRFAAPARARPELWRVLATLVVGGIAFGILMQSSLLVLHLLTGPFWSAAILRAMEGGRTEIGVIGILASFIPLAFGLALAIRVLHDRSWISLFGPARLTRHTLFRVGGGVLAVQAVLLPIQALSPQVGSHLSLGQQLPWLMPALIGILVQSATEEALFRGYLLQQMAVQSRSRLAWMVAPSVLFALLHIDPTDDLPQMLWTGSTAMLFGLAAADITARTGTLGPAIGMHMASNISGLLLVGLYGRMDGLALFNLVLNPMRPWDGLPYMAIDLLGIVVAWLVARLILRV